MKKQNMDRTRLLVMGLLSGGDMYGYQMIVELERRSDGTFSMKEGTLYPVLHGLEQAGFVEAYQQEAPTGRLRKYYHLTRKGGSMLETEKESWERYSHAVNAVQAAGNGLCHSGHFGIGSLRNCHALSIGSQAVVGKTAVHIDTHGAHMVAHLLLALTAGQALATVDVGVNGDQLADLQAFHAGTDLFNVAGEFVAQNDGRSNFRAALAALINMHVRTADTASADTQQHLALTGFGEIQLTGLNGLITKKICANHC